jgi:hypothetical protein
MKRLIAILTVTLSLGTGCTSFLNVETLGKSTISGFFADIDGLKAIPGASDYLPEWPRLAFSD